MKKRFFFFVAFSGFLVISFGIATSLYAQSLQGVKFTGSLPTCNGSTDNMVSIATGTLQVCYGSQWTPVSGSGSAPTWILNSSYLYPTSTSLRVGIGTTTPATTLVVNGTTTITGGSIFFPSSGPFVVLSNIDSGDGVTKPSFRLRSYTYETSLIIGKNDAAMTGTNNIDIGENAGYVAVNGGYTGSVAIGYRAGYYSQGNSVHIGLLAGYSAGSYGANNVAVGAYSGYAANTYGTYNVFVGYGAGYGASGSVGANGGKNTMVGGDTGSYGIGTENSYFGYRAGYSATGARSGNTALGAYAGYTNNGVSSTFVGYRAGYNDSTGSKNIVIGYNIDSALVAGSNQLNIGNIIYGTSIDGSGGTISTGNIGIATTTPAYKLDVAGTGRFTQPVFVGTPTADNHAATKSYVDSAAGIWVIGVGGVTLSNNTEDVFFGDANGTDLTVGSGAGKIDVGTVDPVYTIGGVRYATYMTGMTGVKEETTGVITLGKNNVAVLDFKNAEVGSDLWLFGKTTNLKNNFEKLSVLLTSGFDGNVWYKKDAENLRVFVYGTKSGEVSYRLTAPRFDAEKWTNFSSAEHEGFNLDSLIRN